MVLHVDVLHVPVGPQHDADDDLVAHVQRPVHRFQRRPGFGVDPLEQFLFQLERRPAVRCDLADVFEVLPVNAAPTDAVVGLRHLHRAELRLHFAA